MVEQRGEKCIETPLRVQTHLDRIRYAIKEDAARMVLVKERMVDAKRARKYTNRYTLATLFPDENPVAAITRELLLLSVEEYLETVQDRRYPDRSDLVVFGKKYGDEDVYMKIRVELQTKSGFGGGSSILVLSFHFAETSFLEEDFPYRRSR